MYRIDCLVTLKKMVVHQNIHPRQPRRALFKSGAVLVTATCAVAKEHMGAQSEKNAMIPRAERELQQSDRADTTAL